MRSIRHTPSGLTRWRPTKACAGASSSSGRRRSLPTGLSPPRLGHESILRMVEDRYRLRPLTARDAKANSIAAAFGFTRSPRRGPPELPTPPSIVSQPCGPVSVQRS